MWKPCEKLHKAKILKCCIRNSHNIWDIQTLFYGETSIWKNYGLNNPHHTPIGLMFNEFLYTCFVTKPSPFLSIFLNNFSIGDSSPINSSKLNRPSKSRSILSKNSSTSSLFIINQINSLSAKRCPHIFIELLKENQINSLSAKNLPTHFHRIIWSKKKAWQYIK